MPGLWEWSEQPQNCLWKQLLNAGTRLNPGLTAKLDVNYCVDILFSLTVTAGTAACPIAAALLEMLQPRQGLVGLIQTITSHTLWATLVG